MHESQRTDLIRRPLESELFGIPVFTAYPESLGAVDAVADEAATHVGSLTVIRIPATAIAAIQRVEARGGRLCDVLLTLTRSVIAERVSESSSDRTPAVLVRRAVSEDATALGKLSDATFQGFQSHWHQDEQLARSLADRLYVQWSRDLLQASTGKNPLLVATNADNALVGFLALNSRTTTQWHVPLTGVHPDHRGMGTLSAMLDWAAHHIAEHGGGTFEYETQLTNLAALRAVARCGFALAHSRMTFHLWSAET